MIGPAVISGSSAKPTGGARLDDISDAALLAQFIDARDQSAFVQLVEKRGPMVYGVCQRVLSHRHDAEDAFQATFFALARAATNVRRRWGGALAAWLHGTAYRVSLQIKRTASRRKRREELRVMSMNAQDPTDALEWNEARGAIDEEVQALPERYRRPVVLCYFAGMTREAAARELQLHPRSVERRLATGLLQLEKRLSRRGVVVTGGLAALLLTQPLQAAVPSALFTQTTSLAFGLSTGGAAAIALQLLAKDRLWSWIVRSLWLLAITVGGGLICWWVVAYAGADAPHDVVGEAAPDATLGRPTVTAWGRVVDLNNQPVADIPVLLLTRPVRLRADGGWEPLYDSLAEHMYRGGRYRELARVITDADGRYRISGILSVPDPHTGAGWFHTLPVVETQGRFRIRLVETGAEHRGLEHRSP